MRKGSLLFMLLLLAFASKLVAHPSWGIVVDSKRNIYFCDIMHNERGSLWMLEPSGELKLLMRDFHAHNVSLGPNGTILSSHGEMDEHYLLQFENGKLLDTLFVANNYKDFNGGNSCTTAKGDIIFGADHYVWKINEEGKKEKLSPHYFEWNQSIYADEDGIVFAPEIGDSLGKIYKISPDGSASIYADRLITKLNRPYKKHADILLGITRGCNGKIYAAELAGHRIVEIDESGEHKTFYKAEGDWLPTGIDFFSGEAYILEFKEKNGLAGPRITKINEAGVASILFDYESYKANLDELAPSTASPLPNSNLWLVFAALGTLVLVLAQQLKRAKVLNR